MMIPAAIARTVLFCARQAWLVIAGFVFLALVSGYYLANHFAITTDVNNLLSPSLPWRQQELMIDRAFPQRTDLLLVVVDGSTPEHAEAAATELAAKLAPRTDLFKSVRRPDGDPFFARNGILFQSVDQVKRQTASLINSQAFLGSLAADPSLRGIAGALSQALQGVRMKKVTFDELQRPITQIADALERSAAGRDPAFSWRTLLSGQPPSPSELRHLILIQPILDFNALQPGKRASDAVRDAARELGLTPDHGVRVRLTGQVALSDEEYGTLSEGAMLNGIVTVLVVLTILWLALKQPRLILSVAINLLIGLAITAAVGLWMVGALNLLSVAFAVLFVGLGVDFGIQFSVRYRAERHETNDLMAALRGTGLGVGGPLLLAAASTAAGFYSFLPTSYRGISELGLIAGTGMIVAFLTSIMLLPALIAAMRPPGEPEEIGFKSLAPVDRFLERARFWIIGITLGATVLGAPLLMKLRFDFNPLDLNSRSTESVSTLLDLMQNPQTNTNTIDALAPGLPQAVDLSDRLAKLPEVAETRTLQSFVPADQDAKLAVIEDAGFFLQNTLNPETVKPAPTDAEVVAALKATAQDLAQTAGDQTSRTAEQARRLGRLFTDLANGTPAQRQSAHQALVVPLVMMLDQVRALLTAEHVTIDTLPPALKSDWIATDGRARIQVSPKGDPNDNTVLENFAQAVLAVVPDATGGPVFILEAANTIVTAFWEAALWAIASITVILFIVLRRPLDVALTLVPLMVAIVVTLELCVLIGWQLNYANIIALPLLLGVGVAFKIYYVMAWRSGETNFLQLSLTRAVLFSALATATAFGSLWLSHHPGTSSMGKLMALALVTTLAAATLFQPALLATSKHTE
jgi:hopanoid biosynthesis associated RND transporter like protein HpnN